jgi:hypothetical protein
LAAASAAIAALASFSYPGCRRGRGAKLALLLTDGVAFSAFSAHLSRVASRSSHRLAVAILEHHRAAQPATRPGEVPQCPAAASVRSVMERHGVDLSHLRHLSLPSATSLDPPSFHAWLDSDDTHRRPPPSSECRLSRLLDAWQLPVTTPSAVIVPERAASRASSAHGTPFRRLSASLAAGVSYTTILPVATANPSDHYVLAAARRYLSVDELALSAICRRATQKGRL